MDTNDASELSARDRTRAPIDGASFPRVVAEESEEGGRYPHESRQLVMQAETAHREERFGDAVRYWQDLAAILQEQMPQAYYDRLGEAYLKQQGFPPGLLEEECVSGEEDKHALLRRIHVALSPSKYLEIGVQNGTSFKLAARDAVGVDPMPWPDIQLSSHHRLHEMTSDEFFEGPASDALSPPPDLVFIDGMHLFEFALRDFMNVERFAASKTIIVIDDIYPGHVAQAERQRRTKAWTGDVWRVHHALRTFRPDLQLKMYDAAPTGLLTVTGLNPDNTVLFDRYKSIVHQVLSTPMPYETYVLRQDALPCSQLVDDLANIFFSSRGYEV